MADLSAGGVDVLEDDSMVPFCAVCNLRKRKYCCPRCGILTCTLECCLRHKKEAKCSGKRDAAKFVASSAMTLGDLRRDASFLEGVERLSETTKRCRREAWAGVSKIDGRGGVHHRTARLQSAAERRRIQVLVMPNGMSRHRNNTSSYDAKSNTIFWRVEWLFEHEAALVDDRANERTPLKELVRRVISRQAPSARRSNYEACLDDSFHVLLKKLPGRANQPVFDMLDKDVGLDLALTGKCVIEHPTVHVVRSTELSKYHIADAPVTLLFDLQSSGPAAASSGADTGTVTVTGLLS